MLVHCRCTTIGVTHCHIITDAGLTVQAPIRSREFLEEILTHLRKGKRHHITLASNDRRQIRHHELTRWEMNHLSERALNNLCRIVGG